MPKYLLLWNIGYGECEEVIKAGSLKEATNFAYENAKNDFESNVAYKAKELTPEVADRYGYEYELDD